MHVNFIDIVRKIAASGWGRNYVSEQAAAKEMIRDIGLEGAALLAILQELQALRKFIGLHAEQQAHIEKLEHQLSTAPSSMIARLTSWSRGARQISGPDMNEVLSVRARKVLRSIGCHKTEDIYLVTRDRLLLARQCGTVTLDELIKFAALHGHDLSGNGPAHST